MRRLSYSVWKESGLYYWSVRRRSVHFRGDEVCAQGAATNLIRARAEAIACGFDFAAEGDPFGNSAEGVTPTDTSHIA